MPERKIFKEKSSLAHCNDPMHSVANWCVRSCVTQVSNRSRSFLDLESTQQTMSIRLADKQTTHVWRLDSPVLDEKTTIISKVSNTSIRKLIIHNCVSNVSLMYLCHTLILSKSVICVVPIKTAYCLVDEKWCDILLGHRFRSVIQIATPPLFLSLCTMYLT